MAQEFRGGLAAWFSEERPSGCWPGLVSSEASKVAPSHGRRLTRSCWRTASVLPRTVLPIWLRASAGVSDPRERQKLQWLYPPIFLLWKNIHNPNVTIFSHFKCTVQILSRLILLCSHYHQSSPEISTCKTEILYIELQPLIPLSPCSLATNVLSSVSINVTIRATSCTWSPTVF